MREVSAVQSSEWQMLTDILPKLSLGQYQPTAILKAMKAQPDQQTFGPCLHPESQQSNKDEQSMAMGCEHRSCI